MPPRVKRELLPGNNPGFELVPQLLCRDADDFVWAARLLFGMGYGEVNFNLGCPSGTVAAKGKGAGFLAARMSSTPSSGAFSPPCPARASP